MKNAMGILLAAMSFLGAWPARAAEPAPGTALELVPPAAGLVKDHPRLLLRPKDTPHAISVAQLKALPRDAEFNTMLAQLRKCGGGAPNALAWLLTGEQADAEKALAALTAWKPPEKPGDPFGVYFGCRDMALAYDWLHGYAGFSDDLKKSVRDKVFPLAEKGFKSGRDHVFHNYVWMWNCGAALWALASAGDDPRGDKLLADVAARLNADDFPAMAYLQGLPADSPGYWSLYCLTPGVMVAACAQSAFDQDVAGRVAKDGGDWLSGQLENLVHQALPNMRHMPWGDQQSGGDGGIAHEMACTIDQMTWLTRSPTGAYLSRWLTSQRGARRFYGETVMFYFLYTRHLGREPREPALSHLSGGALGGNWIAREKWADGATVLGFHCTDCYTGHNHFDQGSFVIYRQELLAVDSGSYKSVGGSQQKTASHNTLLFGGVGQRGVHPHFNVNVADYVDALKTKGFETGNMLFHEDKGTWAAAAGEFGQAYAPDVVGSAVRQMLFVRPGTVVVVDRLAGPQGKDLPEVSWLLHVSAEPKADAGGLTLSNGKAWLRCRALLPGGSQPAVTNGLATLLDGQNKAAPTWRAEYKYPGKPNMTLIHILDVGDGSEPGPMGDVKAGETTGGTELSFGSRKFVFAASEPFGVSEGK
jgi:hypothetical protein